MLAKIITCECYYEKFHSEGHNYVKKLIYFHCMCREKHLLHVLTCEKHPYIGKPIPQMTGKKCTSPTNCSHEIFKFCCSVRYLLNFRCFKLCVKRIPSRFENEIQTAPQYFKSIKRFEPFFVFNNKSNKIEI